MVEIEGGGAEVLVEVGVVVVDAGDDGQGVGDVPLGEAFVEVLGEFSASVVVVFGAGEEADFKSGGEMGGVAVGFGDGIFGVEGGL